MLTEDKKNAVREMLRQGLSQNEISRQTGVSRGSVQGLAKTCGEQEVRKEVHRVLDGGQNWYKKYGLVYEDRDVLYLSRLPDKVIVPACSQIPLHHADLINYLRALHIHIGPDALPVLAGDLLDWTFMKYPNINDISATEEIKQSREIMREIYKLFPRAIVLTSNHLEDRIKEAANKASLPDVFLREWREVYGVPDTWRIVDYLIAGEWLFEHGHGVSKGSKTTIRQQTVQRMRRFDKGGMSIVRAHRHTESGPVAVPEWENQRFLRQLIYVGCMMDEKKVSYTRSGLWNTVLELDKGRPTNYPMEIGMDGRWSGKLVNPHTGEYI